MFKEVKVLLTQKDLEVFKKIQEYIEKEGMSPSVRDICNMADVVSTSSAHRYVEKLKKAGLIDSKSYFFDIVSLGNFPGFLTGTKPASNAVATGHPNKNPLASGPTTTSTFLSLANSVNKRIDS